MRGKLFKLVVQDQNTDQHSLRLFRFRVRVEPELRRFAGQVEASGITGNLDGALHYFRVSRAHRQVGVRLAGQFEIPALQGNFREQDLEHRLSGRWLRGQVALYLGKRGRFCSRGRGDGLTRGGRLSCRRIRVIGLCRKCQRDSERRCGKEGSATNECHGLG